MCGQSFHILKPYILKQKGSGGESKREGTGEERGRRMEGRTQQNKEEGEEEEQQQGRKKKKRN